MSEHFKVAIVGGGPAGLAAGAQAAKRGISHVVLERGELAQTIVKYQKGKHVMAEPAALPLQADLSLHFEEGTREEVLAAWTEGTRTAETNLRQGSGHEVTKVEGGAGSFMLTLKDGRVEAEHVVLAIGVQGNPNTFRAPGADLPHVTYQLDDPAEHSGKRIVVVGVGDAGIENALALTQRNHVSIVNRQKEIVRAKERNREAVEQAIAAERIAYYTEAAVERIEPGAVVLGTPAGTVRLEADLLIGRLGARAPREFLEAAGVTYESTAPQLSPTYESTAVPGLYLIGTVGGCQLIKDAMNQGFEVIEHILGQPVAPADEPLLREKLAALPGSVTEIVERLRASIPLLAGLSVVQLREFLRDCRLRQDRPGVELFNRTQYGTSLYAILTGSVDATLPLADADLDTVYRTPDQRQERRVTLGAGDFFGEISLLSDRPHTGTVKYGAGCTLLEMPRPSVTRLMRQVRSVRETIDHAAVRRKLRDLVGGDVGAGEIDALANAAEIEKFDRGATVFEQGAAPDGLHVVRRGSVTVSIREKGREAVVAYVPAGNVVGEMALLSPEARRSATVRATVWTETLRVPMDAILPFLEKHAGLRSRLATLESERLIANVAASASQREGDLVSYLINEGAGEASDILLIDDSLCVRCNNCEQACAGTHGGISRLDREAGPTFAEVHVPTSCRHCENPACMTDCPPDALRRHPNGEVFIMDTCIGCGNCERNCPYHVIQMAEVPAETRWPGWLNRLLGRSVDTRKMAVKCDLCLGLAGGPACEASCPTGAIVRVNPKTYIDAVMRRL
jgi:CRP-like cAMP-binding protein/thioredoxin reductase/Pyruvate/2-oxoacid:ferredoxin oxidoreductase delta subunit